MDGLAWMFALLVTGIGLLVMIYARYYMSPDDPVVRFFSFLLGFMGSMLGIVLSGNLIQLAFFWELTSLFSFLLIGYWHHTVRARDGARMALTVTGGGGLRSEEHTSELQSLMRISYAVFCLKKKHNSVNRKT